MKTIVAAVLGSLLFTACSPEPGNTPKIAESQRDALDKAKGVEAAIDQNAEEQRQQIDQQGQ